MARIRGRSFNALTASFAAAAFAIAAISGAHATEASEPQSIVLDTTADPLDRPLVQVMVNGRGPFNFVVDTGANRSSVSRRLVEQLGLTSHSQLELNSVTSADMVDFVTLASLSAGALRLDDVEAPILSRPVLAGADGVLGIDAVVGMRVVFDFEHETIDIRESGWTRNNERRFTRMPSRILDSGLAEVETRIGRVDVNAIIDTGADSSLGNLALRRAIHPNRWERWRRFDAYVIGVTDEIAHGELAIVSNLGFGRARLAQAPVFFADLHIFDVWGRADEPSLVIGMDILQRAGSMVIDYGTGEVLLDIPSPGQTLVTVAGGGSRLRRPGEQP